MNNWNDAVESLRGAGASEDPQFPALVLKLRNSQNYYIRRKDDNKWDSVLGIITNEWLTAKPIIEALAQKYRPQALTPGSGNIFGTYEQIQPVTPDGKDYTVWVIAAAIGGAALLALASGKPAKKGR